ncbi:unnamed protein product [Urochloa humidicola]
MAAARGSNNGEEGVAAGEAPKLHQAAAIGRGLLGLAATSTAITLAVIEPPAWLDRNAYYASISGMFFAGMAQVIASVWEAGVMGSGGGSSGIGHVGFAVAATGV